MPNQTPKRGRPRMFSETQDIVSTRLPPEVVAELDRIARERNETRGEIIRKSLEKYLARNRVAKNH